MRRLIVWLAVGAIAVTGLQTTANSLREADGFTHWAPRELDAVSRLDEDLRPARALLAGQRTAGYACDVPYKLLMTFGYEEQTRTYFLSQYALAPTLLLKTPSQPVVFAQFEDESTLRRFAEEHHYDVAWNQSGRGLLKARSR